MSTAKNSSAPHAEAGFPMSEIHEFSHSAISLTPEQGGGVILERSTRPLTARQGAILEFIRDSVQKRGYPPTLREIGTRFGIRSTNGVNDHLVALERKGYLTRKDRLSRGLRVVGQDEPDVREIMREENASLREIIRRLVISAEQLPRLTAQFAVAIGDARAIIGRRHT